MHSVRHMSERRHGAQFFDRDEGRELREELNLRPRRVRRSTRSSGSGLLSNYDDKPRARRGNGWKQHRKMQFRK